jgi:hypothetical protein
LFKISDQGSTIKNITSKEGYHFVGFISLSWNSSNKYVQDLSKKSFIFTLKNPHNIPPSKYPLIQTFKAICCSSYYPSTFGLGADICLNTQSDQNTNSYTRFPFSYSYTTGKVDITLSKILISQQIKLMFLMFKIKTTFMKIISFTY